MSPTILVADDDKSMLAIFRFHLNKAQFKVLEANDGKEAITLIEQKKPEVDLLITDFHMPNMNGLILAQTLKNLKHAFPIILTTSDTDILLKFAQGKEYQIFDDMLAKPVSATDMIDKINRLLQRNDSLERTKGCLTR